LQNIFLYLLEFFLYIILIASTFFYGSILPFSSFILQVVIFLLGFLFLLYLKNLKKILYPKSIIFLFLFFLIVIFEIIPLPYSILKILSPNTALLYSDYLFNFKNSFFSISVYPFNTFFELLKYITYFIIFLISLNIFNKREQFERLIIILVILGSILSIYGVMKKYFIKELEISSSFSVFYNRNHFSAYMIIIANLAIGYSLSLKERSKKILFGFLGALISSCIFLSLSRAGILSLCFSLFLLIFFIIPKNLRKIWIILIFILFTIIFINIAGIEPIRIRFLEFWKDLGYRLSLSYFGLNVLKDFFIFGIGLGNFPYIFTKYNLTGRYSYYLLNEHLQLMIEAGFASIFYFLFFIFIFKDIFSKLKTRQDLFVRYIVFGGICGLFGVLFHSFFEFNFHIPAISILFWAILGFIYKCVYTHFFINDREKDKI